MSDTATVYTAIKHMSGCFAIRVSARTTSLLLPELGRHQAFELEACRSLISMYDSDSSGTLGYSDVSKYVLHFLEPSDSGLLLVSP